jgi:hypothetical protein
MSQLNKNKRWVIHPREWMKLPLFCTSLCPL